ncbi:DUF2314 domain-containing protein [Sagittula sp. NFXS13]|uniref:DUF2314 domain-containing protein n=1 Tax=Sagittula sp. NFXS13 TaxID=2819095 RepID=UPI0032DF5B0E
MTISCRLTALLTCLATATLAQESTIPFAQSDPDMNAAITEARSHLDAVLSRLIGADGQVHPALNLKASLPVTHFEVENEIIWIDSLAVTEDGGFTGHLANVPSYMPGHELGDTITFDTSQIVDWSVLADDGRMFGHYTTRVMMRQMTAAEAEQIGDLISADPMPDAWR